MAGRSDLTRLARSPYTGRFLRADLKYALYSLVVNRIAGSALVPRVLRIGLYRLAGIRTGMANLYPGIRFLGLGPVRIVESAAVNAGVVFDNKAAITIEAAARVGPDVFLCTSNHEMGDSGQRAAATDHRPITIGRGAWIGARAVIMPGVTVGAGSVVAGGAVVFRDTEPDGVYTGNPARKVQDLRSD